jgi:hypothetical protein
MIFRAVTSCMFSGLLLAASLFTTPARAAAGDGPEAMVMDNMCMVMFGYDMIHITAYQPGRSRDQYCEQIPSTGKAILTFDIANPSFRDLPIEVRIIRDPLVPISADTDLEPLTEVHLPAKTYKTGTFNFEHDFTNNGHYIGLVTLTKANGEKETQQFKFMVGETLWAYVPQILGAVLIMLMVAAYWRHSHPQPKAAAAADAVKSS